MSVSYRANSEDSVTSKWKVDVVISSDDEQQKGKLHAVSVEVDAGIQQNVWEVKKKKISQKEKATNKLWMLTTIDHVGLITTARNGAPSRVRAALRNALSSSMTVLHMYKLTAPMNHSPIRKMLNACNSSETCVLYK